MATMIGARILFDMQNQPGKLIRHHRSPLFFPWRPVNPVRPGSGKVIFIATASDLSVWRPMDVTVLESARAPLRLVRPGSMTQPEMLALPNTVDVYFLDVWCCDEEARRQLMEVLLPLLPTLNDYKM
jgi:hypothetical protein